MSQRLNKIIGFTFLVQVFIFLFSLTNNILLSRWLGPSNLGMVALFFLFTEAVHKFTNLGLETASVYYLSNGEFPRDQLLGTTFINALGTAVLGSMVILATIHFGFLNLFFDPDKAAVIQQGMWWCVALLVAYLTFDYGTKFLLGEQRFRRYNEMMITRPVLFLILLLTVYGAHQLTVPRVLGIYSVSWFVPGVVMWLMVAPFAFVWSAKITRATVRYGIKIMLSNLLTFLNYRVDVFLVGFFLTQQWVGQYYVALIVSEKLLYLTQSTSTVFFPAASHSTAQQQKTPLINRVNFLFVLLGATITALLAHWFIPLLFSSAYQDAITALLILLPGVAALTIPKVLSADFSARGKPEIPLYIGAVNFVTNLVLNIILIPRYGIEGAALSSTLGYFLAAGLIVWQYHRSTHTPVSEILIPRWSDIRRVRDV